MVEILLGSEYDDDLFARLIAEVKAVGGSIEDKEWILGGSQERTVFKITLPGGALEAVAETYVGLSLRGEAALVGQLVGQVCPTGHSS